MKMYAYAEYTMRVELRKEDMSKMKIIRRRLAADNSYDHEYEIVMGRAADWNKSPFNIRTVVTLLNYTPPQRFCNYELTNTKGLHV